MCRWPIGDPGEPDFHFCGRKKFGSLPYCEHHVRMAYQPVQLKAAPSRPSRQRLSFKRQGSQGDEAPVRRLFSLGM